MQTPESVQELAENLEEYAPSRADFRNLSDEDREQVAKWLVIGRSQVRAQVGSEPERAWRRQLEQKRDRFYYSAGQVGMQFRWAEALWREVVL